MANTSKELPSLETALTEIAALIDNMEHKELTLEQSLTDFERGIFLIKHCQKILSDAEQKVQMLVQQGEQDTLVAFKENKEDEGPHEND